MVHPQISPLEQLAPLTSKVAATHAHLYLQLHLWDNFIFGNGMPYFNDFFKN